MDTAGEIEADERHPSFNPSRPRGSSLAHWDSRPRRTRTGSEKAKPTHTRANDGASGVAILMEIARQIKAHPSSPPAVGVDLLLDDGETTERKDNKNLPPWNEVLCQEYAAGLPSRLRILLDMVGDKQLELLREPIRCEPARCRRPRVVHRAGSGVYQFTDGTQRPVIDDHLPLIDIGIKTIDLHRLQLPRRIKPYCHTTQDTPDKCSPESLEAVGTVLLTSLQTAGLRRARCLRMKRPTRDHHFGA